jgi:serine/threonine-protein kinase
MAENHAMAPQQMIAHYRITAKLGEGGMGEVWRATDTKLGREVAIKILPAAFTDDADRLARFEREARVLASLNHPNIAAIYGVEDRALIMELVEGPTLAERIAHEPIPLDEALSIAKQIAEALNAAHEKGIVHRDLKPANVKLTADGRVKVLDFGLAKAMTGEAGEAAPADPANSPTLTMHSIQLGIILGTARYMAPEQVRGKAVDRRADIWAFGVVLYEMLTGRVMFQGETMSDILAAVLRADIDLKRLPPGTPAKIRHLLQRCLERDPKRRLRDIGDAWVELVASEEPVTVPGSPRASRWLWILAVVFGAIALAGWLRPTPTRKHSVGVTLSILPPASTALNPAGGVDPVEISPDGSAVLFTTTEGLMMRRLDSLFPKRIPVTSQIFNLPFWSPDSSTVIFNDRAHVYKVRLPDGAPEQIAAQDAPTRGGS